MVVAVVITPPFLFFFPFSMAAMYCSNIGFARCAARPALLTSRCVAGWTGGKLTRRGDGQPGCGGKDVEAR